MNTAPGPPIRAAYERGRKIEVSSPRKVSEHTPIRKPGNLVYLLG